MDASGLDASGALVTQLCWVDASGALVTQLIIPCTHSEHGAMSPEHMDQWRVEEMKRQQLATMHGYRSPYPHPAMQQAPSPQPHSQKHTLQSPPEDGTGVCIFPNKPQINALQITYVIFQKPS